MDRELCKPVSTAGRAACGGAGRLWRLGWGCRALCGAPPAHRSHENHLDPGAQDPGAQSGNCGEALLGARALGTQDMREAGPRPGRHPQH